MGLLVFAVIGVVVGVVIGYKMPQAPGGPSVTAVIGLTGGLAGGIGGSVLSGGNPLSSFGLWSLIGALAGAIVVLALYALIAAPGLGTGPGESTDSGDATTGRH